MHFSWLLNERILKVGARDSFQGEIDQQHVEQCYEQTDLIVTWYSRIRTDQTKSDAQLLKDNRRGLLAIKRKILQSLVGQDLQRPNGDYFLRNLIYAKSSRPPSVVTHAKSGIAMGRMSIVFGFDFDHDLTSE